MDTRTTVWWVPEVGPFSSREKALELHPSPIEREVAEPNHFSGLSFPDLPSWHHQVVIDADAVPFEGTPWDPSMGALRDRATLFAQLYRPGATAQVHATKLLGVYSVVVAVSSACALVAQSRVGFEACESALWRFYRGPGE